MAQMGQFFVEHYTITPFAGEKNASSGRQECEAIMERIYNENPTYWPYGLNVKGHQDVYLVKDATTKQPVGFVGWQEFTEYPNRRVGSYSVGILPEYRGNGYATEAVARVLREKSAGVDEVRSYVVHSNVASHGLADKLGVQVHESF